MESLGQRLRASDAKHKVSVNFTPDEVARAEAKRIGALKRSMHAVTEKAKADIIAAIEAGKSSHDVESRVSDAEPAFRVLHKIRDHLPAYSNEDAEVRAIWNLFIAWATVEELEIELHSYLPAIIDGEREMHAFIGIAAKFARRRT